MVLPKNVVNRCANKCIVLFLLHTYSQHRIVHFLQKTVKPNRTHTLPGPPLFTNCSLFASCTSTTTPRVDLEKRFLNSGDHQTSWYLEVPSFQTMWSYFFKIILALIDLLNWRDRRKWFKKQLFSASLIEIWVLWKICVITVQKNLFSIGANERQHWRNIWNMLLLLVKNNWNESPRPISTISDCFLVQKPYFQFWRHLADKVPYWRRMSKKCWYPSCIR